jgi:GT2 family glycosyltransferase
MNTNPHINYEIIVVDNGSTDGTRQFLKGLLGNVQVLNNTTNLGFAKACNQGVALARARYLVFLNNDTIPFPGWLEPLFEGIEKDGADIVGAKLIYPWGRIQHAGVAFNNDDIGFHLFRRMPYNSKEVDKKRWVQCVTGACMFMKKETFIELGGFCEEYINGVEDVDFCLTAVSKGKKILYNNESLIVHYEETSVGRKKYDQQNLEKFFTRWKNKIDRDGHRICFSENLNFIN